MYEEDNLFREQQEIAEESAAPEEAAASDNEERFEAAEETAAEETFAAEVTEQPEGPEAGEELTDDFDAVVGEEGEIEGLVLDDGEKTDDAELPETIAAAAPIKAGKEKMSKKSGKRKGKLTFGQRLLRFFLILMCLCIIAGSVAVVAAAMYLTDVTADDNKVLDLNSLKLSFATTLMAYDSNTEEWYEYERLYGDENRVWVNYSDMPEDLIKVTIASEDMRFLTHHGVDWKRTIFAFLNEYVHRMTENTQGGSTITQQVIKNLTQEKSVAGLDGVLRKLREIYRALELEKNYSKEQIMEAYLNTIGVGSNVAGIEAGANYYFGKTTSELTLAESAAIVCITKYPTANNPYLNPEENMEKRGWIIQDMYDNGMITEEEFIAAREESHNMVFDEANKEHASSSTVYSYFTDATIEQVLKDLQEVKGLTAAEAEQMLYKGGLTIYLTMDPFVQETVEATAFDQDLWPKLELKADGTPEENQMEAAIVVMDYEGHVRGIAGGIREKTASRSLNRATQSTRQPGSSFKPVAVYAPALELKKIHFSSLFLDTASEVYNGNEWPRNFDRVYGPPITVYQAVARSLNTVAVHTMKLIGYDFSFDFLTTSLGYTTLVDKRWEEAQDKYVSDRGLSTALGGITDGITVLEHTAAYAVFGNGGMYYEPMFYTQICDRTGDVILDKTKYVTNGRALSEQTAYIMNQMLRGVVKEGTGTKTKYNTDMPLCGKSGTTSDNHDFWYMGFNPYYVCGCWMGYDMPKSMSPYSLHYDTQYAWRNIMQTICQDLPYKDFPKCEGVVSASFCITSGDLATGACSNTRTGFYTPDNMPGTCNHGYLYGSSDN